MKFRYSLRKCKSVLRGFYSWYVKNREEFSEEKQKSIESDLLDLDQSIVSGKRNQSDSLARNIQELGKKYIRRSPIFWVIEFIGAIAVALVIALIVRQSWFELYEIPTGSMRPTFHEQDRLIVSKTAFGLDYPFLNDHFYFDPDLVKRSGVFIWSGHDIDLPNTDTKYFWFIPFKKQYVKRLMGKPGDTVYFYGGHVYGIDSEGNELTVLRESPWMVEREYIPFLSFEGRPKERALRGGLEREWILTHFNQPIGKIVMSQIGLGRGEIQVDGEWVPDLGKSSPIQIQTFSDFWGIGNFAMAKLLTPEEAKNLPHFNEGEGSLYLELAHTPALTGSSFHLNKTLIPLDEKHINVLKNNLYTSRFVVRSGYATQYNYAQIHFSKISSPYLADVPDGTYEFERGTAYVINTGGWRSKLPADHPLYSKSLSLIQTLFNNGIQMDTLRSNVFPHRYAYYRNGDLFVMGAPLFKDGDFTLTTFITNEKRRANEASVLNPYTPFVDHGAPNVEKIARFGLKIPERHYLALGDNHANSGDSRIFGFVPQNNLKGIPSLRFWPPGSSWTLPSQSLYPWITFPNLIIWTIALIIFLIWYRFSQKRLKQPIVDPKTLSR